MAQCISPFTLKTGVAVPCAKCYECTARRVSGWSFRIMKELERSSSAYFITLTYDPDHCPVTSSNLMTLNKIDYQVTIRELRRLNPEPLKYYTCGEYGTKSWRPHYHAIIFNLDLQLLIGKKLANLSTKNPDLYLDGTFPFLSPFWPHGQLTIGKVSEASVGYTLKYISKPKRVPLHQRDDRIPEFSLMSKKLGSNYLSTEMREWHESDLLNRCYTPLKDGKKIALPRYYKEKIYSQSDRELIADKYRMEAENNYQKLSDSEKNLQNQNNDMIIVRKFKKSQLPDSRLKTVL